MLAIVMKGRYRMKTVTIYEPGDLITADQAADHFGYSRDHFRNMMDIRNKVADPRLICLKIETDETWRKVNRSRARYVFEYESIRKWYETRQRRPSVKARAGSRRGKPNPIL
jgi:hypothetical protein